MRFDKSPAQRQADSEFNEAFTVLMAFFVQIMVAFFEVVR